MWALFDFVCQGQLLGTSKSFKQEYENPIVRVSTYVLMCNGRPRLQALHEVD